ncbi:hypothetical protein H109_07458 [Trichophyton interdigitale MR816]|uniref:Wax synthase domain-containing protein n=1 Tax=Trichophyton interdigitale (strain MR816) TaxID=1215338 RepID=A0A059IYA4_TRIIM|nr:hypothetical protein H101_02436 [Trichophyton interdigitale H6]KDB20585.1 hypothetical protein H109_07458 [Trichophyton interdigitale MR816]
MISQCLIAMPQVSPAARRALSEAGSDIRTGLVSLMIPAALLYLALYALVKKKTGVFVMLDWMAIFAFAANGTLVVLECSVARSLQLFAVAIGTMKALDFYARRKSPPKYTDPNPPSDSIIALLLFTELRYESFTPNYLRTAPALAQLESDTTAEYVCYQKRDLKGGKQVFTTFGKRVASLQTPGRKAPHRFSEAFDLVIHAAFFLATQFLFPLSNPTVQAIQILLAIYVIWESLQLLLRYKTSPPLFGPVYTASSLASFWSETWHTAFASPCRSLAYDPLRRHLPAKYGVPQSFAKGVGIIASFSLMGLFHAYSLAPVLPLDGILRIIAFFLLNGIGTVIETAIWGRNAHWGKALLAWTFEIVIASWTVEGLSLPKGLQNISWDSICNVGGVKRG